MSLEPGWKEAELLDAATDGIAKLDRNWIVQYVNRRGLEMLGPGLAIVGKNYWDSFPDTVYEGSPFVQSYHRAMEKGEKAEFCTFYGQPPLHVWLHISVHPASDGIIVFFRDISNERKQQEALEVSRDRLRTAQHIGKMASWEWDLTTNSLLWDEGNAWVYGRSPAELVGYEEVVRSIHEGDRHKVELALQSAIAGAGDYRCEFRVIWPDGSIHWLDASGRCIRSADGEPIRMIGINTDITERKLADAAILQNEKLAAVGRMASSIAHEINNPLEAITNLLYLARHSETLDEARPLLQDADSELRRAAAITNHTLRFHKQQTRPTMVTFQDLATGIFTGQHSRLINAKVSVQERDRAPHPVLCFEGEIRQVLNNLISNAIDAMKGRGGTLYFRARNGHDWRTRRSGLIITVADTGSGISPAAGKHLFDAFYTSKGAAGNGLGLWISRDMADQHEGRLAFRSSQRVGRSGTVFTLFLPNDAADRW